MWRKDRILWTSKPPSGGSKPDENSKTATAGASSTPKMDLYQLNIYLRENEGAGPPMAGSTSADLPVPLHSRVY